MQAEGLFATGRGAGGAQDLELDHQGLSPSLSRSWVSYFISLGLTPSSVCKMWPDGTYSWGDRAGHIHEYLRAWTNAGTEQALVITCGPGRAQLYWTFYKEAK